MREIISNLIFPTLLFLSLLINSCHIRKWEYRLHEKYEMLIWRKNIYRESILSQIYSFRFYFISNWSPITNNVQSEYKQRGVSFSTTFLNSFFWTAIRYFNPRCQRETAMTRPSQTESFYAHRPRRKDLKSRFSCVHLQSCAFFDFCRLCKFERTTPPFLRSGHTWSRLGQQPG